MKKLLTIPIDRLCPQCRSGRMLAVAVERSKIVGEFDSVVYRRCSHCDHKNKSRERMIGVEIDIPDSSHPSLFEDFPVSGD